VATFPAKTPSKREFSGPSRAATPEFSMHDTLQAARELARHWHQANRAPGEDASAGLVIVLEGHFVGHLPELPPASEWAAGCLAIAVDGQVHLARPVDFRGRLEWADLGPESSSPAPPELPDEEPSAPPTDS
jgi:hypothetical protein